MRPDTFIRPWGSFDVYDESEGKWKAKTIYVRPDERLSLQKHLHRDEIWYVVAGFGTAILGSEVVELGPQSILTIPAGTIHRIENTGDGQLVIFEVQVGTCDEEDIIRLDDDYGRAS